MLAACVGGVAAVSVDSPWCTEMAVLLDYRWLVIVVAVTEMDTRKMRVLLVHLLLWAFVEILRSDIRVQFLLWVLFAEKKTFMILNGSAQDIITLNHFPSIHDKCRLLSFLVIYFWT